MLLPSTSSSFLIHFAWQLAHIDSQDAARRQSRLSMTSSRILFKSFRVYAGSAIYTLFGVGHILERFRRYTKPTLTPSRSAHTAHTVDSSLYDSTHWIPFGSAVLASSLYQPFRSGLFASARAEGAAAPSRDGIRAAASRAERRSAACVRLVVVAQPLQLMSI